MTVRELIELNQMIVDAEIEIRDNHKLVDVLCIGCERGTKPYHPRKVPESPQFIGNITRQKEACYVPKSINAWDDDKDYWQVKPDRFPKGWLDLTVYSWEVWPASLFGNPRRRTGNARNVSFHGQRINIVALPGYVEFAKEPKVTEPQQIDGQMNIAEFLEVENGQNNNPTV